MERINSSDGKKVRSAHCLLGLQMRCRIDAFAVFEDIEIEQTISCPSTSSYPTPHASHYSSYYHSPPPQSARPSPHFSPASFFPCPLSSFLPAYPSPTPSAGPYPSLWARIDAGRTSLEPAPPAWWMFDGRVARSRTAEIAPGQRRFDRSGSYQDL